MNQIIEENSIKSWIIQPNVCRCCLFTSGTWDIYASYITDLGKKEVFSDMLQECYGISLSNVKEKNSSNLICDPCAGHLRDAYCFRKQVLMAETKFSQYYKNETDKMSVKLEDDTHYECTDLNHSEDDTKTTEESPDCRRAKSSLARTKNTHKTVKSKRKKRKDVDYDSDVPLTELSKKIKPEDEFKKIVELPIETINSSSNEDKLSDTEYKNKVKLRVPSQQTPIKQLSERKRVILTCEIVLKDTTACPFRHHKSWFQCFFCTKEFMDITTVRNHITEQHQDLDMELRKMKRYPRSLQIDISDLKCRECHVNLIDVDEMQRHFSSVHNKTIYNECIADYKVNNSPYSCHLCKQEFHVFRTLTTHLNEHYANCICDVCGRSFLNSKRLKVHKRTHENGQYPCTECGKILKTKTSKANHMETHSKRVIKCQICFKPMKHYNDRIKHMSEVHNITHMFKCKICFKEYNIKHYLATHMRQTHGNKNKKCDECGMAFITNHGLKKHMTKHTGVKPHKCVVCGKAYARSYTLREHMRTHETSALSLSACDTRLLNIQIVT